MYPPKLSLLLVDDEKPSTDLLHMMIDDLCPEVESILEADSLDEARQQIAQKDPDVVFLDIELSGSSGFDLFKHINHTVTRTVFVTAYSQYAIKAIKCGAEDYLLKPIDSHELVSVIKKLYQHKLKSAEMPPRPEQQRLMLPHQRGFNLVHSRNIVRLKADNNYTELFLYDGQHLVVSKPIKDFEHILDPASFYRVHKSFIINLAHFKEYKSDCGDDHALMCDGAKVPISRLRMAEFLVFLNNYATSL